MKLVNLNGDQETKIHTYLPRRSLMKLLVLLTFGLVLWISGCDQSNADSALTMEVKKEGKMESIATIKASLPSLDAAAPAETRTATFALG